MDILCVLIQLVQMGGEPMAAFILLAAIGAAVLAGAIALMVACLRS